MELKEIYIIIHVIGAIIGVGGAYVSDIIFFKSVKDRFIETKELKLMKISSIFVWTGLITLLISGILIFSTNPATYMSSSKFILKMFVVLVIFVNGIIFHLKHIPLIDRHADEHYPSSDEFTRKKKLLTISGTISITSWTLALILGILGSIPFNTITALALYIAFEVFAVSVALILSKRMY